MIRGPRLAVLLTALALGVVAFALVVGITDPPGPGLDPDALSYLGAAQSLAARGEYRVPSASWSSQDSTSPLTHFPPGYPTAIALPVRLGMAPPQAARLVQAIAAFVAVATLVLLVGDATSPIAGALFGAALFAMRAMLETHLSVLSEPLFLALTALTLAAMTRTPDRPLRAGVPAALAALTRYAGVALVGGAALWMLAQRAPRRVRVRRALVALLPAVVLQGVWVLRTRRTAGPAGIRRFAIYGNLATTLREGAVTLRDWLVPDPGWSPEPLAGRGVAAALVVVLLALVVAAAVRRARRDGATRVLRLMAASAALGACYMGVLIASRLFADPGIPFDARLLAPLLLLATTVIATALAVYWRTTAAIAPRLALAAGLALWWSAGASVVRRAARYALDEGADFAGDRWRRSPLLAWARTNGAGHPLYTNWPVAVYVYLQRPSHTLPPLGDRRALAAFADTIGARDGRVLAFDVAGVEYVTGETLAACCGLRVVARLEDGIVLAAEPPSSRGAKARGPRAPT